MTKEIIVNAGEMESRVAVLENGRLMELHVEREPKIVGNIYKGRVTKVLKGMDAAFVDIGVERNAFLSASDVIPQLDDDDGNGNGHGGRHTLPPITQLLRAGQDVMVQVVRAPMGTKGARITTRLSLPGRYCVLMLNSGRHTGVSRKIEDPKERQRLRAIAARVHPENYSLIIRTEAEGKSEEDLRQDVNFLVEMAGRIETKSNQVSAPALVHGDLTLIFRLIRDAFTRDVNRVVVDSPSAYENVLELVEMIAPGLKNRIFLYNEMLPIFHAYNIEPEVERTLRRKVWLPSGGYLIIDQAEALTAIDVNTGRFVGSVELAETVLTTNLQAADEVARQLRLRDLGGIIVVDFIDMDNARHRQQVTRAFEEALRRDRAKIKMHNISPLGLVEMTRKRTGESLTGLLTEPCPFCSGIGRIQNTLTMALRVMRDLATAAVEHPNTEAFLVTAHPRVIANVLGYEGEAHRDLEQIIERPIYLRAEEHYHPNTFRLEQLLLEQALAAVDHLEEGEVLEGRVVNPDPELSLSPLVMAKGIYLVVPDLDAPVGAHVKVRVREVSTSMAIAEPLAAEQRGIRGAEQRLLTERPPLVAPSVLPSYLREELAALPPRELPLLSPSAEIMPELVTREEIMLPPLPAVPAAPVAPEALAESTRERRRKKSRRRRHGLEVEPVDLTPTEALAAPADELDSELDVAEVEMDEEVALAAAEVNGEVEGEEIAPAAATSEAARRRRRRRRGRGGAAAAAAQALSDAAAAAQEAPSSDDLLNVLPADELPEESEALPEESEMLPEAVAAAVEAEAELPVETTVAPEEPAEATEKAPRRRRRSTRRRTQLEAEPVLPTTEEGVIAPEINPEDAAEALLALLNAIPEPTIPEPALPEEPAVPEVIEAQVEPVTERRTRRARSRRRTATVEPEVETPVVEAAPAAEAAPEEVTLVAEAPVPEAEAVAVEAAVVTETAEVAPVEEAPVETPAVDILPEEEPAVAPDEEPAPAVVLDAADEAAPVEEAPPAEEKPARRRRTTTRRRKTTEE